MSLLLCYAVGLSFFSLILCLPACIADVPVVACYPLFCFAIVLFVEALLSNTAAVPFGVDAGLLDCWKKMLDCRCKLLLNCLIAVGGRYWIVFMQLLLVQ